MPQISIIIPCYNQEQYLDECLTSVMGQTFGDWECIIVNDGSPDNSEELAQKWTNKDARFKYFAKENGGLSSARNFGIEKASSEFILPLDADDKISSEYLELSLREFAKDNNLKVVYCKAEKFGDENGEWLLKPFSLEVLSRENMIFCTAIFRKKEWQLVGGYDSKMIYGWEDWEFWISLLKNGGNVKCIDKICFYYRVKSVSMVKQINAERYNYLYAYMSVKHADFFVKYYGSFFNIRAAHIRSIDEYELKLKSKKFALDLFCKRFFKFSPFGLNN